MPGNKVRVLYGVLIFAICAMVVVAPGNGVEDAYGCYRLNDQLIELSPGKIDLKSGQDPSRHSQAKIARIEQVRGFLVYSSSTLTYDSAKGGLRLVPGRSISAFYVRWVIGVPMHIVVDNGNSTIKVLKEPCSRP